MGLGWGRLLGGKTAEPSGDGLPEPAAEAATAFVRRDPVFDRDRRPVARILRLQHADTPLGEVPAHRQPVRDDTLIRSLAACVSEEGWGDTLVFVPLCSASTGNPRLAALPAANVVLLLSLAPEDTDPGPLTARLADLRKTGFRLALFRQPAHPAYAAALALADFAAIDVAGSEGGQVRDFSIAMRSREAGHRLSLLAVNVESGDDLQLCQLWKFDLFHGRFADTAERPEAGQDDPGRLNLLHLLNLVRGDAENAEIAAAFKHDPLLTYRILRYLGSAAVGLARPPASIDQALLLLGRQRLARWLSVLLFSVKDPDFADWLLVDSALVRGRIMELLGAERFPAAEGDHLFLTGVFSRLDRLLRQPLPDALARIGLPTNVRNALLRREGPYAPLLAVAEAAEAYDPRGIEASARAAGVAPEAVNRALLEAAVWTSEITKLRD